MQLSRSYLKIRWYRYFVDGDVVVAIIFYSNFFCTFISICV